ncbi:MOSC domain-containing protein [Pseudalkalibacillus sp. SCS-8]|uniref:MOSC domain-containing protein n=1 Tax=Pseudalkalibacillus nanhaiensis TaxID=3115291 RepID=UPI0032DBAB25
MRVGAVKEVVRYPVKSMQGEHMESVEIHNHGAAGDHIFAWEMKDKPGDYLTIPKYPFLLDYEVHLNDEGELKIQKDDLQLSSLQAKEAETHFTERAGVPVSLVSMDVENEEPSYWEEPLLIATTASLKKVKELTDRDQLDMLRFRPNLILDVDGDTPFLEESWIGKELIMNDVVLHIKKACERCSYVNVDSETKEVDPNVLKTVVKENKNVFGVYATVKKTGIVRVGDTIEIK